MTELSLKVSGLPIGEWSRAHAVAAQFLADYPAKRGFRNGCVYSRDGWQPLYVYRTKTQIVVRGTISQRNPNDRRSREERQDASRDYLRSMRRVWGQET